MIACYQTDPGKVRSHNEDSVTIVKNMSNEYLCVVADGMGGHKAGEVASSLAVNELSKRFSELSSIGSKEEAVVWLKEIIDEINVKILRYAEEHIDASGLGTTCVCAIVTDEFLLYGNIGDSSGYVLKNGKLYKVTTCRKIPIPLVPIDEQSRIVSEIETRFAACDAAEKQIDASLVKAELLRQSILKKAFSGELI